MNILKTLLVVPLLALISACGVSVGDRSAKHVESPAAYKARINSWRKGYEKKLLADDGWLTLAGLFWLKEGRNTIGFGEGFDIALPERSGKGKFGVISFEKGVATLEVEPGFDAKSGGRKTDRIELASDENGKPTVVDWGDLEMLAIKRQEKVGLRVRDRKSPDRKEFSGLKWFEIDRKYEIVADFIPFDEPREIPIPNVLDQTIRLQSPGILRFGFAGRKYTVQPVLNSDGRWWIIFRDRSSRSETYGGGRFLYTDPEKDGKVILDFNMAENPPCAYTDFATCPLPPRQNDLHITINAGEKRYREHMQES